MGLLKRKNWARIVFIIIMELGIAWNIFGVVFQVLLTSSMPEMPAGPDAERFESMMTITQVFVVAMAVGLCILFGWTIKKLISQDIRSEFLS